MATADGENSLRYKIGAAIGDVVPPEEREAALEVAARLLTERYAAAARKGVRHMPEDVLEGVRNGFRYRQNAPGEDRVTAALVAAAKKEEPERPRQAAPLFTAYEDLADAPPPGWLVEGAIPDSGVTVIYGPPKSGKSLFAADLSAALAAGTGVWCGQAEIKAEAPKRVVYFALEGLAVTVARVKAWLEERGSGLGRRLVFGDIRALMTEAGGAQKAAALAEAIRASGETPGLVVIDTWAHLMAAWGLDENATRDQNIAAKWVEALSEALGCPVVVLAHSGKEDRGIRGSNALEAAAAAVLSTSAERGRFTIRARLMRSAEANWRMMAFGAPVLKAQYVGPDADEDEDAPVAREPTTGPDDAALKEAIARTSDALARQGVVEEPLPEFRKTVAAVIGGGNKQLSAIERRAENALRACGLVRERRVMILPGVDMQARLAANGAWLE